jgi:hypothetical protein
MAQFSSIKFKQHSIIGEYDGLMEHSAGDNNGIWQLAA